MNRNLVLDKVRLQNRVIGDIVGSDDGPTMVFIGGIHGNEPSGVLALQRVFGHLKQTEAPVCGRFLGLAGNLPALATSQRFISRDLNRLWDSAFTERFRSHDSPNDSTDVVEYQQQNELFEIIEPIVQSKTEAYFLDLHTTSSESAPFIGINDQLDNRKFAMKFPVATVLGIEEYLEGPLLSYMNDFGSVALAFEAGQHEATESVELHESFIYRALIEAGIIDRSALPSAQVHDRLNSNQFNKHGIFEVTFRHAITEEDSFKMNSGFRNFDRIKRGDELAHDRNGPIHAPRGGKIFMPLYQGAGNDGFFIVRGVPGWALSLSTVLRKINFERVLTLLPGVSRSDEHPDALVVNEKIAVLLATEIFHLLGYRRKKKDGSKLIFSRREIAR